MEIVKNMVVKAVAGRDKGSYFVVMDLDGGYALIADGKRRLVEKPKRKNEKHLRPTGTSMDAGMLTNRCLRTFLRGIEEPAANSSGQGGKALVER